MAQDQLSAPPILSTPDTHIFTAETENPATITSAESSQSNLSDEQLVIRYEIERTVNEIRKNRWSRVALQFPDGMLRDSARVFRLLKSRLLVESRSRSGNVDGDMNTGLEASFKKLGVDEDEKGDLNVSTTMASTTTTTATTTAKGDNQVKLTILGDTSYGSCCVDEIAAEHVDAEVVVHYGRACLSPTARLPVIHIFTKTELNYEDVLATFESTFLDKEERVVVTADIPFAGHVHRVCERLKEKGYRSVYAADIVHNPSSPIPNRTLPDEAEKDSSRLAEWCLFHISDPPTSLLLTLSSCMKSVHIFPKSSNHGSSYQSNTSVILRRRYALITSLSTVSTWGILINTLSVKNYLHIVEHVKKQIAAADKKSYLFVVGKLNAAKVANFAEIGGWVVIGCWESSLIDSRDFYRPIITPYELEIVLQSDDERVWTGRWRSDFQGLLDKAEVQKIAAEEDKMNQRRMPGAFGDEDGEMEEQNQHDYDSEEESMPPEFDLRTGKYVSHSRPMRVKDSSQGNSQNLGGLNNSSALTKRSNGDLLAVKGIASPAAQFLAEKRTWQGLGSDFEIRYEDEEEHGGLIEEGRTGVARGYTVADSSKT